MSPLTNITGTVTAALAALLLVGCSSVAPGTILPVSSSLPAVTALPADADPGQPAPTESTRQTLPAGIRTVTVSDASGDVAVTGVDGARITLVRHVFAYSARPPETVKTTGSDLRIDAPSCAADDGLQPCRIDYEIQVPRSMVVSLTGASGNLTLTGITGQQSAIAASGNVKVMGSSGAVTARSTSGNVTVQAAAVPQSLEAGSVSGNASVAVPGGRYRVETATTSGDSDVTIANDAAATALIHVTSVSGNVSLGTALHEHDD